MSTQFIHVAQFLQTIFCFSILILIGQRIIMIWKKLDDKYLQQRKKQIDEEFKWQQKYVPSAPKPSNQFQKQQRESKQRQNSQLPQLHQQTNLRTNLVQSKNDQTDRKLYQNEEEQVQKPYKRKSLTDLMKQQQRNSKQVQIKDQSDAASQRKRSTQIKYPSIINQRKTDELNKTQLNDLNSIQPSITSNYSSGEQDLKGKYLLNTKIHIFNLIDSAFNQHLPILMCLLVLGIIVHSTYIFTMICLFGYVVTHLLLKLKNSTEKLNNSSNPNSFGAKIGLIIPKIWIIALFISYWSDTQYA